jgi:hypothetical protein
VTGPAAPLPAAEVERAHARLGEARMLPAAPLESGVHVPGPIVEREDAVHHFVGLIAAAYLGRATHQ